MNKELFKNIAMRQLEGLMFHSNMADYYGFLNLKLFQDFHNRQYLEESRNFRKIKDYFTCACHTPLFLDFNLLDINSNEIMPRDWAEKSSLEIDEDSLSTLLKSSLEFYLKWEVETCRIYTYNANLLFENNYYDDYCFVEELIAEVNEEIRKVKNLMIDLSAVDYEYTKIKGLSYKLK